MDLTTIKDLAGDVIEQYKRALVSSGVREGSELVKNAEAMVDVNGTRVSVVFKLADYWKYVEDGRKAGKMPPIDDIKAWIEVRKILPRPGANGKLPTTNQLAYLIARSISKRGLKGNNLLKETVNQFELKKKVKSELTREIKKQLYE